MKEKSTIEFTKQEAEALLSIIHLTVKAVGLEGNGQTAKNATYFMDKINASFAPETQKEVRDKVLKKVK
jgi:hypothetical protein